MLFIFALFSSSSSFSFFLQLEKKKKLQGTLCYFIDFLVPVILFKFILI